MEDNAKASKLKTYPSLNVNFISDNELDPIYAIKLQVFVQVSIKASVTELCFIILIREILLAKYNVQHKNMGNNVTINMKNFRSS